MEPIVIPWMSPEETEKLLRELKAPMQKDKAALAKPIVSLPRPASQLQKEPSIHVQSM